jgi:hypothetical protein
MRGRRRLVLLILGDLMSSEFMLLVMVLLCVLASYI